MAVKWVVESINRILEESTEEEEKRAAAEDKDLEEEMTHYPAKPGEDEGVEEGVEQEKEGGG